MILYESKLFKKYNLTVGTTDIRLNFKRDNHNFDSNLLALSNYLGIDTIDFLTVKQTHSTLIINAKDIDASRLVEGDAIFLDYNLNSRLEVNHKSNIALGIKTADCIPIIIHNTQTKETIAIHAGRKGVRNGIVDKCLELICNPSLSNPQDLIVYIGPNIGPDNHIVYSQELEGFDSKYYTLLPKGQHVINNQFLFDKSLASNTPSRDDLPNLISAHLDLSKFVIDKLLEFGIPASNIDNCKIDTFTNLKTHSYRRDAPDNGLSMTFMIL